ncbi:MAG: S49 family peptidase [Alphaproteobacteria bacterium]|nr:S49 family peptidase [Alphaproteobacteria bacterium]
MPLAIMPEKLAAIVAFLGDQSAGIKYPASEIEARIGAASHPDRAPQTQGRSTAVIPIRGVIAQRANMLDDVSGGGGTSTEIVGRQLREVAAMPGVDRLILDIDSPGGSVYGVAELAAEIARMARGPIKITAQVNSLAASAAYWIASQASEIVITPGGEAGSIGVYTVHEDISARAEAMGVKRTYISAGKYKTEGNPFAPLDDEARGAIQARVDEYYSMFVSAVAAGRSKATDRTITPAQVRGGFGQGRVAGAVDAVRLGLADRIGTLDQTLAAHGASGSGARRRAQVEQFESEIAALDLRIQSNPRSAAAAERERLIQQLERG